MFTFQNQRHRHAIKMHYSYNFLIIFIIYNEAGKSKLSILHADFVINIRLIVVISSDIVHFCSKHKLWTNYDKWLVFMVWFFCVILLIRCRNWRIALNFYVRSKWPYGVLHKWKSMSLIVKTLLFQMLNVVLNGSAWHLVWSYFVYFWYNRLDSIYLSLHINIFRKQGKMWRLLLLLLLLFFFLLFFFISSSSSFSSSSSSYYYSIFIYQPFQNLHTFKCCLQRQLLNKNTTAVTK